MFKKLVDKKTGKVKFDIIRKTKEEYISATFGCITIIDIYCFLASSSASLVIILDNNNFETLKKSFPDNWEYLNNKLAYAYEYFNSIDDSQKPVDNLNKEELFTCPTDNQIERPKKF